MKTHSRQGGRAEADERAISCGKALEMEDEAPAAGGPPARDGDRVRAGSLQD